MSARAKLGRAVLAALILLAVGPVALATAAPPVITIASPLTGSSTNNQTPTFRGTTEDIVDPVVLNIYAGATATGTPVQTLSTLLPLVGEAWELTPGSPLAPGTYTAVAEQTNVALEVVASLPVTFTVDIAPPEVSLDPVVSPTKNATPTLEGTAGVAEGDGGTVAVAIYAGSSTGGTVVASENAPVILGAWSYTPAHLEDGTYTAQATQEDAAGNRGTSVARTFTIKAQAPAVTLSAPENGSTTSGESQLVAGAAGTAPGDLPEVTVQLFTGSTIQGGQSPVESIMVGAVEGKWSVTFGGLGLGSYSVRALQSDEAGNVGVSEARTFEVTEPTTTTTTATVTTTTTSTATTTSTTTETSTTTATTTATSTTTATTTATSTATATSTTTTTTTATDTSTTTATLTATTTTTATSTATATTTPSTTTATTTTTSSSAAPATSSSTPAPTAAPLPPAPQPLVWMQPFPVVRIAGSYSAGGVKLSLLTVQAPDGAVVTMSCRHRGCPRRTESRVVSSASRSREGATTVEFRPFERFLRAGVVLEVRVVKRGEIGKFTRFEIRKGRPPVRVDECLDPVKARPMACPPS